ncbi:MULTISPECIES: hypothetical protein, partial [Pirellulaceae]|uniref:hypothetical protein n=1 Tax=Pirellulaceae TaxID=2691357 RepID=UPI001BE07BD1
HLDSQSWPHALTAWCHALTASSSKEHVFGSGNKHRGKAHPSCATAGLSSSGCLVPGLHCWASQQWHTL